ncbi:hypothetical protein IWW37_006018 [Coemansia sp. RSA 2050]|nr:hypothetical protein IWW37_006018 [Coemansia sp. RSA 2050]
MKSIGEERRNEMASLYNTHHVHNNDSILKLTEPLNLYQRRTARGIVRDAVAFLEKHLRPDAECSGVSAAPAKKKGKGGTRQPLSTSRSNTGVPRSGLSDLASLHLGRGLAGSRDSERITHIGRMRDWLSGKALRLEKGMYNPITSFVWYVSLCVQAEWDKAGGRTGVCRLICPAGEADYKPHDSDDNTRIDIGLCCVRPDGPTTAASAPMPYHKLVAVIEAKVRGADHEGAFPQLYGYIRQMYQTQHDLRYAWGLTICGHKVYVCHFGNDKAVSSRSMDVTTPEGRCAFIELLVSWSMCDDSQLGRDTTIEHLVDLDCWRIDCPDDEDRSSGIGTSYYYKTVICHADHLFGRHTRCFLATDVEPTAGSELEPKVVIKDAWAFAERLIDKDFRDEVKILRKIRDVLSVSLGAEDNVIYPEIVVGGRVWLSRGDVDIEDSTDTVYQGVKFADNSLPRFRVHRRIVLSQIGERLHSVGSVNELVTVVCDVMRCHNAIFKHCQILHRDISDNNVLVVRQGDGTARGLLIDFDYALDMSIEKLRTPRPEMTGTLLFMSINNLRNWDIERTVLDDYESMLCLVCWVATAGIGGLPRRRSEELEKLPIARWRNGTIGAIVDAKSVHFGSLAAFKECVTDNFSGMGLANSASGSGSGSSGDLGMGLLAMFAIGLRQHLFNNRSVSPECRGTSYIETQEVQSLKPGTAQDFLRLSANKNQDEQGIINPFEKRAKEGNVAAIAKDLDDFITKY